MTTKHTPGPWVNETPTEGGRFHVMTKDGYAIADMATEYSSIDNDDEHEANARLIKKAPELLDELTMLANAIEAYSAGDGSRATDDPYIESRLSAARMLIAEATGAE